MDRALLLTNAATVQSFVQQMALVSRKAKGFCGFLVELLSLTPLYILFAPPPPTTQLQDMIIISQVVTSCWYYHYMLHAHTFWRGYSFKMAAV